MWPCKLFCILVQKLNCLHTKHMGQVVSFDAVFMYMCEIARDRVFVGEWCQLSMHFLHLLALAASVASKHACPNKQASQWCCSYSLYFLISNSDPRLWHCFWQVNFNFIVILWASSPSIQYSSASVIHRGTLWSIVCIRAWKIKGTHFVLQLYSLDFAILWA